MFEKIRYDLNAIKSRDPAARNKLEVFLLYSGFHAVFWYRLSHWLFVHHCFFLARLVSQVTKFFHRHRNSSRRANRQGSDD